MSPGTLLPPVNGRIELRGQSGTRRTMLTKAAQVPLIPRVRTGRCAAIGGSFAPAGRRPMPRTPRTLCTLVLIGLSAALRDLPLTSEAKSLIVAAAGVPASFLLTDLATRIPGTDRVI